MNTYYITYYFPGIICSDTTDKKIASRDPLLHAREAPEGSYAFRYYDKEEITFNGETLNGKDKNKTGYYWIDGEIYDHETIKQNKLCTPILLLNMECNDYKYVVSSKRQPNWIQPLYETASIINVESGEILSYLEAIEKFKEKG